MCLIVLMFARLTVTAHALYSPLPFSSFYPRMGGRVWTFLGWPGHQYRSLARSLIQLFSSFYLLAFWLSISPILCAHSNVTLASIASFASTGWTRASLLPPIRIITFNEYLIRIGNPIRIKFKKKSVENFKLVTRSCLPSFRWIGERFLRENAWPNSEHSTHTT